MHTCYQNSPQNEVGSGEGAAPLPQDNKNGMNCVTKT